MLFITSHNSLCMSVWNHSAYRDWSRLSWWVVLEFFWLAWARFSEGIIKPVNKQVSRLAKSAASNIFSYFVSFGYTGERLIPGLRRKDWILRALLLAVKRLWPHKVGSRGEIYSARWKLMLMSDRANDLVKKFLKARALLFSRWFTSGILNKLCESEKVSMPRFMWRKREFIGVIWQCFARVKCGNIMSGFRKCCDCHESHLLCDLSKTLTNKAQVCCWARVTSETCIKRTPSGNAAVSA